MVAKDDRFAPSLGRVTAHFSKKVDSIPTCIYHMQLGTLIQLGQLYMESYVTIPCNTFEVLIECIDMVYLQKVAYSSILSKAGLMNKQLKLQLR